VYHTCYAVIDNQGMYARHITSCLHRFEILESTWNTEPDKRPSFSDIVHTLSDGVEYSGVTSDDVTVEHATESDGYIDVHAE